jgi:thiamine monophosphate synthase
MKKTLRVIALALIPVFAVGAVAPEKVIKVVEACCGLPCPGYPLCPTK